MKVVILTSETPANVWLVNQILATQEVVGMVIERRPLASTRREKSERRRQMLRQHGFLRTINKLLYNIVQRRILASTNKNVVRDYFFSEGVPIAYARSVPTVVVPSVNDRECLRFVQHSAADILAVCGTTVLRPEIFSLAPRGAINIHTGITPEYRSADPIFWALYCGEPEKVGVTIHFIDRGIDTGPIIHQDVVPVYADDSLETIYGRCVRRGAELYLLALSQIEDGSVRTRDRSGASSRAFRSIDLGIVQYLLFLRRFRKLAGRLPREADSASAASTRARRQT